jgi:hypothetical protein
MGTKVIAGSNESLLHKIGSRSFLPVPMFTGCHMRDYNQLNPSLSPANS